MNIYRRNAEDKKRKTTYQGFGALCNSCSEHIQLSRRIFIDEAWNSEFLQKDDCENKGAKFESVLVMDAAWISGGNIEVLCTKCVFKA